MMQVGAHEMGQFEAGPKMREKNDEIPAGYLRVTQVLEPFSGLHHINQKTLEKAADRGTRVHSFCTLYALDLLVMEPDEDCKLYVEAFKVWFDSHVQKVLYPPKRINSAKYKLSGEYDLIVLMKGDVVPTLVDLKTPERSSRTWQLQTAAYKRLVEDDMGVVCERRICLMIPKHDGEDKSKPGSCKAVVYDDHQQDEEMYFGLLKAFRFLNG